MLQILEQRSAWGTCVGLFCMNYLMYFLLTWLPFYLMQERHFPLAAMAKIAGLAYFLMLSQPRPQGGSPIAALLQEKLQPWFARRLWSWDSGGWDLACCLRRQRASALVVCLLLAAAFWGISASNTWAITQTLAGPKQLASDGAAKLLR